MMYGRQFNAGNNGQVAATHDAGTKSAAPSGDGAAPNFHDAVTKQADQSRLSTPYMEYETSIANDFKEDYLADEHSPIAEQDFDNNLYLKNGVAGSLRREFSAYVDELVLIETPNAAETKTVVPKISDELSIGLYLNEDATILSECLDTICYADVFAETWDRTAGMKQENPKPFSSLPDVLMETFWFERKDEQYFRAYFPKKNFDIEKMRSAITRN